MQKNTQNLIDKKNKLFSEIKLIKNSEPQTTFTLLDGKTLFRKEALEVKYNQLKILKFLFSATVEQIERKMNSVKAKMCKQCQKNIHTGDLQCRKDFNRMVFCNMAYQAIQEVATNG
jgi:hypothetical protein